MGQCVGRNSDTRVIRRSRSLTFTKHPTVDCDVINNIAEVAHDSSDHLTNEAEASMDTSNLTNNLENDEYEDDFDEYDEDFEEENSDDDSDNDDVMNNNDHLDDCDTRNNNMEGICDRKTYRKLSCISIFKCFQSECRKYFGSIVEPKVYFQISDKGLRHQ